MRDLYFCKEKGCSPLSYYARNVLLFISNKNTSRLNFIGDEMTIYSLMCAESIIECLFKISSKGFFFKAI